MHTHLHLDAEAQVMQNCCRSRPSTCSHQLAAEEAGLESCSADTLFAEHEPRSRSTASASGIEAGTADWRPEADPACSPSMQQSLDRSHVALDPQACSSNVQSGHLSLLELPDRPTGPFKQTLVRRQSSLPAGKLGACSPGKGPPVDELTMSRHSHDGVPQSRSSETDILHCSDDGASWTTAPIVVQHTSPGGADVLQQTASDHMRSDASADWTGHSDRQKRGSFDSASSSRSAQPSTAGSRRSSQAGAGRSSQAGTGMRDTTTDSSSRRRSYAGMYMRQLPSPDTGHLVSKQQRSSFRQASTDGASIADHASAVREVKAPSATQQQGLDKTPTPGRSKAPSAGAPSELLHHCDRSSSSDEQPLRSQDAQYEHASGVNAARAGPSGSRPSARPSSSSNEKEVMNPFGTGQMREGDPGSGVHAATAGSSRSRPNVRPSSSNNEKLYGSLGREGNPGPGLHADRTGSIGLDRWCAAAESANVPHGFQQALALTAMGLSYRLDLAPCDVQRLVHGCWIMTAALQAMLPPSSGHSVDAHCQCRSQIEKE